MAQFQYKATDPDGKLARGTMIAANVDDLETRLSQINLSLLDCDVVDAKSQKKWGKAVSREDIILFSFHMEQMTRAGVPLLDGLGDLRDSVENPRFREALAAMVDEIQGGKHLSETMSAYPNFFDTVYVNLIQVGEQTGNLPLVFHELTESLKWEDEIISQAKKAMMYPTFVGVVVFGLVFFLMIYLVPQLVAFIKNMGGVLPIHTRILIATSNFFVQWWYVILATPFLVTMGMRYAIRTSLRFRRRWDQTKLNLWLYGPLSRKMILARFANAFALMYSSGVTVIEGLRISEGVAGNLVIQEAIEQVGRQVGEGQSLSVSFQNANLFPQLVLRMIKVGESTGQLDLALRNVSYFYSREVKELIGKLQTMIEPAMTVILGTIIGWIMISVLGPIYDLIAKIK